MHHFCSLNKWQCVNPKAVLPMWTSANKKTKNPTYLNWLKGSIATASLLIGQLNATQLPHIMDCTTAATMWQVLQTHYTKKCKTH